MDDLTIIDGIGPATSKALEQAGIATMAALAAVDPAAPPVEIPRADWAAWVAEARKRVAESAGRGSAGQVAFASKGELRAAIAAAQAAPPKPPEEPANKPMAVLVVRGPQAGRRRAGRRFGAEPVRIPVADLTADQVAALEGDAALVVTREEA